MGRNRLILINGAPGVGKSTVAEALARDVPLTLVLDVDGLKHSLGRWQDDPIAAGLRARAVSLAAAEEHLAAGFDVVIGQYLARIDFIEELEALAIRRGARFAEFILDLDAAGLAARLVARKNRPDRPEHAVNNGLVGPTDAADLVRSLEPLRRARPDAVRIDASGSLLETLAEIRRALTVG